MSAWLVVAAAVDLVNEDSNVARAVRKMLTFVEDQWLCGIMDDCLGNYCFGVRLSKRREQCLPKSIVKC
jgi:hypothetical protein